MQVVASNFVESQKNGQNTRETHRAREGGATCARVFCQPFCFSSKFKITRCVENMLLAVNEMRQTVGFSLL